MKSRLEKVIAHPLHRFLGLSSIESKPGSASFSIRIGDEAVNPAGALHGGVIYTLSDVCAYAALLSRMDDEIEAVTHDIQVSVMRPAALGDIVTFSADVVKPGRRISFMDVRVTVADKLIATARVTKSMIGRS